MGVGDGQESLACCSPCDHKESDTTEWLNWTDIWNLKCQTHRNREWISGLWGLKVKEMERYYQRVSISSSYQMDKFWKFNVEHGEHS